MNIKRALISAGIVGTIALTGACTPDGVSVLRPTTIVTPVAGVSDLTCSMFAQRPASPDARIGAYWVLNGTIGINDDPALVAASQAFGAADALSDEEAVAAEALTAELERLC